MANEGGIWRTVGGRRIFIRGGQSLNEAMKESGKFTDLSTYKNKQGFIDFVEYQTKIKLNNEESFLNDNRNILYTQIKPENKNVLLNFLKNNNLRYEEHLENNYWIYFKKK